MSLYWAIFDRSKDDVFGLVEMQVLRLWDLQSKDVLYLAIKCLEFKYRLLPPLVRKLIDI